MDSKLLALYLAELKAAGVRTAKLDTCAGDACLIEVEFFPPPRSEAPELAPATPFRDRQGNPIDLDDGMPELGKDDIAEANFKPKGP